MDLSRKSARHHATALLVVDVQEAAVALGPYRGDEVLSNIAALIEACRTATIEVIYVQHDGGPGEAVECGTSGWEIHHPIRPVSGEKVVHKRFNSAFRETELKAYLDARGIGTLILVGIQTEYCVDTTCRVAFEYGYSIVMPELTNTTFDNGDLSARQIYELYNSRIFAGRFATVPSMAATLESFVAGA